jgi:hypothetical protein
MSTAVAQQKSAKDLIARTWTLLIATMSVVERDFLANWPAR